VLVSAIALASCRATSVTAPIVQPGAPGQPGRVISAREAADLSNLRYTDAEIQFVRGMIDHHAQALEMTSLLPSRTFREDMRLLGRRIEISQADEIQMMREWLGARGEAAPDSHAHHAQGAVAMPGMLTGDEMRRLADAKGATFERLFLELMIKHHEGALMMVEQLFAAAGAGQQSDIYAFATDVDADQRIEIDSMRAMLLEEHEK
jgi:uncharacterized protein (DUF305 family)